MGGARTSACSRATAPRKEERFREALAVARRFGDTDLEFVTLAYLGASLVHADRTEEGMVLLDEALAAVAGSEVDDFFVLEEIFCQLFAACEHAHDVARADQWIRIGEAIAERRQAPGGLGVLPHALRRRPDRRRAVARGRRRADRGRPAVGPRPPLVLRGGALVRLADLRVRQGRFEEAEQLLDGLDADAEAARPLGRDPPRTRADRRSPATSSSEPWTRSIRSSTDGRAAAGAAGRRAPRRGPARRRPRPPPSSSPRARRRTRATT